MPLSNKKLTTEEKIEKSRQYEEDMKRIRERLADIRESKKKLDSEIAEELERAELVTNQTVGKMFRGKMKENLPLEKYGEIIDFMFMHEDCVEFIAEVIAKYKQKQEKAKLAETAHEEKTA
ncbi:MAG: hypothetical protein IKP95_07225 [Ruminococcus sp.]|nr:hypothetical protein [Ruminococcus sp.]